jgi:hypothetical protein
MIGTTECSLEASRDCDAGIANLCSGSGRVMVHARKHAGSGTAGLTMVPPRVLAPSLSGMERTGAENFDLGYEPPPNAGLLKAIPAEGIIDGENRAILRLCLHTR